MDIFVLAFDVKTEKFRIVTLSNYIAVDWYHLTQVNGKLAVVYLEDTQGHVLLDFKE